MSNRKKFAKNNYSLIAVLAVITAVLIPTGVPVGLSLINYAYAHSLPVTETPAPNSIVPKGTSLPSKVTIDFSERPSPSVSTIQVLNSKNEPVYNGNGNFKIVGDHDREAMTTLDTKKLTDGVYTVSWETQSLDDGHIARGSYVFGVGNVGPDAVSGRTAHQALQVQAVTSTLDGFIKWPMIVSQAAVVGGIFSHLFLWEQFGSKIKGRRLVSHELGYHKTNIQWLRRFFIILIASSVATLAAGSSLLFLQITELSLHNNVSSYWLVFVSQISGPSGLEWIMRSITSLIVIASAVGYYYIIKGNMRKLTTGRVDIESLQKNLEREREEHKPYNSNRTNLASSLLYIALIAGSISIFSNSITSHNAGVHFLPSLSISLDWVHFMVVSIWVGGLFYMSAVLLTTIRASATTTTSRAAASTDRMTREAKEPISDSDKNRSIVLYYLALLLPRFSLLATISFGVIGVTGLYMAWTQLHSFNALFSSSYGNILIIKLSAALPLVLLGAYHQLRLHRSAVLVASLAQGRGRRGSTSSTSSSSDNIGSGKDPGIDNNAPISQTLSNNYSGDISDMNNNKGKIKDIPSRFGKTIKIESLLAMGVLLVASLLTITSPPAMNMGVSSMAASMSGMSITPTKNSTYSIQTKILNVNTKLEIDPFYSGFNTFKVTFTDANGRPNTKVNAVEMTFINTAANMGPIVANLQKTGPGVFSVTGAYISQPGEWDIALAAQRVQDLDLNYEFTAKVTNAPSVSNGGSTAPAGTPMSLANNLQETPPQFDSFAWLAIALAAAVVLGSAYYYSRSKKELRKTIEMLKID